MDQRYPATFDDSGNEICPVTNEKIGDGHSYEEHHIIPIQYGGDPNGLLIRLSPTGHSLIHKQAEAATAKNPKQKYHLTSRQFNNDTVKFLVSSIIRAKNKFNKDSNPNTERKIMIKIPNSTLIKLHKCKLDAGFKSLDSFVIAVLNKHIKDNL